MNNKLAIIIPAYKNTYLEDTFVSIKRQTCQKYNLYVFDDNSPYDIKSLYDKYFYDAQNSHYIKFNENLGGKNLAEHWNRCVSNISEEEWIWLFSDDDIMSNDFVETFYKKLSSGTNSDVLRFNLVIFRNRIDNIEKIVRFPNLLHSSTFFSVFFLLLLFSEEVFCGF